MATSFESLGYDRKYHVLREQFENAKIWIYIENVNQVVVEFKFVFLGILSNDPKAVRLIFDLPFNLFFFRNEF